MGADTVSFWAHALDPALRDGLTTGALAAPALILALALAYAAYTDLLRGLIIPNGLSGAVFAGACAAVPLLYAQPGAHLLGALPAIGLLVLLALGGGMGMGDIKLLVGLAVLAGSGVWVIIIAACLCGVLYAKPLQWLYTRTGRDEAAEVAGASRLGGLPFAPGIALGYLAWLWAAGTPALACLGLLATMVAAVPVYALWQQASERLDAQERAELEAATHPFADERA